MNIRVHIERLVVDGSLGLDTRALEAAVIEGLSQALLHQPTPLLLQRGGSIAKLNGGAIDWRGSPSLWGEQVGRSVHAALGNAGDGQAMVVR